MLVLASRPHTLCSLSVIERFLCNSLLVASRQSQEGVRVFSTSTAEGPAGEEKAGGLAAPWRRGTSPHSRQPAWRLRYGRPWHASPSSSPSSKRRESTVWRSWSAAGRAHQQQRGTPEGGQLRRGPPAWRGDGGLLWQRAQDSDSLVDAQGQPWEPAPVSRESVASKRNCQELWSYVRDCSVERLTFRALSGVMDRCSRLYMHQRAEGAGRLGSEEAAACRELLNAAAAELHRLDSWGLTSFIRLAAAVKYLPAEHLAQWQACMLQRVGQLTPHGVSNCLLSLGTLLTDAAPPPVLAAQQRRQQQQLQQQQQQHASVGTPLLAALGSSALAAATPQQEQQHQGQQVAGQASGVAAVAAAAAQAFSRAGAAAARDAHPAPVLPPLQQADQQWLQQQQQPSQPRPPGGRALRDPSVYELVGALVARALELAPALNPQGLANATYGIATLGWPLSEADTEALLAQVERQASEFNHLEASQLLQAWAKIEDRIEITRGFAKWLRSQGVPGAGQGAGVAGPPEGLASDAALLGELGEGESSEEDGDEAEAVEGGELDRLLVEADEALAEQQARLGPAAGERASDWDSNNDSDGEELDTGSKESSTDGGGSSNGEAGGACGEPSLPPFPAGGVPASRNLFGKLLPATPGIKYVSCYPGVATMDTLLQRVHAQRAQMTGQSLSQFIHSLGCMRHKPPPHIMEGLLQQLEEFLESNWQGACLAAATALLGCAKLAVVPPPSFVAACMGAVRRDQRARVREVLTLAWALSTLRVVDKERWDFLISTMLSQMAPHARLSAASNTVLFHAYVIAKLSNPPGAIYLLPTLADPAREAYLAQRRARRPRPSSFQAAVLRELRNMGYDARLEWPIGGGLIWVDIFVPSLGMVVETDGPWHFIRNTEEYTGGTLCRNWLIERLGHKLVCVGNPLWQHLAQRDVAERSYLLRHYFREFHGLDASPVDECSRARREAGRQDRARLGG